MIVISDTSPITSLFTIGHVELLQKLYGSIIIPPAVSEELLNFHTDLPSFVEVRAVNDNNAVNILAEQLDLGEAQAIVLSKELHADFLLIDEARGRSVAAAEGIRIIGLMGVLVLAKQQGIISSVKHLISLLENDAGFYLSEDVKHRVLQQAGES